MRRSKAPSSRTALTQSGSAQDPAQLPAASLPEPKRRKVLHCPVKPPAPPAAVLADATEQLASKQEELRFFSVLYSKKANKKRKNRTYLDGVLQVNPADQCLLYSSEGKLASKAKVKGAFDAPQGADLPLGTFSVETDQPIVEEKFRSGQCFMQATAAHVQRPAELVHHGSRFIMPAASTAISNKATVPTTKGPVHDPKAANALVLNERQWQSATLASPVTPVVVDPYLCKHLRPHQRDGVKFLYECVAGVKNAGQHGSILADEMGLGKTLQLITLAWSLLRQGPKVDWELQNPCHLNAMAQGPPMIKRIIVVTPSSLVKNWQQEVRKWLGDERLPVLALQPGPDAAKQVADFKHGAIYKMMIASYETLRKFCKELEKCADLLVCDEGHRLKASGGSKTIDALLSLQCSRRILLTGTPVQNNLEEFHAMMSFVNPGMLGSLSAFNQVFGSVISAARDRMASAEERALGETRSQELTARISSFVLRRTAQTNARYLPPLSSYVLFCKPTTLQTGLYTAILESKAVAMLLTTSSAASSSVLPIITKLRKLCNSPALLHESLASEDAAGIAELYPSDFDACSPDSSGKMAVLVQLLHEVINGCQERVVVCSSSTQCLGLVATICCSLGLSTVRIDGATDASKRQDIVDAFNTCNIGQVFLLSTRAGGAGLNLIGASRLLLMDSDWNPAVDLQAMGRIWRDGQKKPCTVYRLLTTGTIEEKIYQRQLSKQELAASMQSRSSKGQNARFTRDELKALFHLQTDTLCDTAELLGPTDLSWKEQAQAETDQPLHASQLQRHVTWVHQVTRPDASSPAAEEPAALQAISLSQQDAHIEQSSIDDIESLEVD